MVLLDLNEVEIIEQCHGSNVKVQGQRNKILFLRENVNMN